MSFSDRWNEAVVSTKSGDGDFEPFIEGVYTAKLDELKVDMTSNPERVTFVFQVTDEGQFKNRKLWRNVKLDDQGIVWLKEDLHKLRLDDLKLNSPADLSVVNDKLKGVDVALFVKPKAGSDGKVYNNAYINGLRNVGAKSAGPEFDASETIPF